MMSSALLLSVDRAGAQTIQGGGPFGGQMRAIAINPNDTTIVYAASFGAGVFKSTDGGLTWMNSGLIGPLGGSSEVWALAIDQSNPDTIHAATGGGVCTSVDAAGTWICSQPGASFHSLAMAGSDPKVLYAGNELTGAILVSVDRGATWNTAGITNVRVRSLAVDPNDPAVVYAGSSFGGISRSRDSGAHWTSTNTGLTNLNVHSVVVDPVDPAIIYAGTDGGFFESTDSGDHWTSFVSEIEPSNVQCLAIDASTSPPTIYAGVFIGGIFQSADRGQTWITLDAGLPHNYQTTIYAIAVDPSTSTTLYAGADDSGMFKIDGGAIWTGINTGLAALPITGLAIDPDFPIVYAATDGGGFFSSVDNGASWMPSQNGPQDPYLDSLAMDPLNPFTIYAGASEFALGAGVYKSDDNGTNWAAYGNGIPAAPVCLATDPVNPFTVYAGLGGNGVYKTTDGGLHWTPANNGIANLSVVGLAVDPVNPTNVFASASGLYKSTDGGASWINVSSMGGGGAIAIDPSMPTTVYADGYDLIKSIDGGITWSVTNLHAFGPIVLDPGNSSTLYVGTGNSRFGGVFKSLDGGASWVRASDGLPNVGVLSLAIDPSDSNVIYAGTFSGVFRSGDGATTWQATGRP